MPREINTQKQTEKPWKTKVERGIILHKDIEISGLQGGKVISERVSLLSFIIGIPLLLTGLWALVNMLFDFGFPINSATIILVLLVTVIGLLLVIGGYFIHRG